MEQNSDGTIKKSESLTGFTKLTAFLDSCSKSDPTRNPLSVGPEKEYLLKHCIRYGLIDPSTFRVTDLGWKLKESDRDSRPKIVVEVLKQFDLGHSSWIASPKSHVRQQEDSTHYIFEANEETESSFLYARFLSDLEIVSGESRWERHSGGIYYCPLTAWGLAILYTLNTLDGQQGIVVPDDQIPMNVETYNDYRTIVKKNYGAVAGGVSTTAHIPTERR